jgi:hypothetical protein
LDSEKIWSNLPAVLLFAVLALMQVAPTEYKPYVFWVGMLGFFPAVALLEWGMQVQAAKYMHIEAICRPSQIKMHLFITNPRQGIHSHCINEATQAYETPLELGVPCKHPRYIRITRLVVQHWNEWEKRMHFLPGRAFYKGCWVNHPQSAKVVLWEPTALKQQIDHLEPEPRFELSEAPLDWYLMNHPPLPIDEESAEVINSGGTQLATQITQCPECSRKDIQIQELHRRYLREHQLRLDAEEEVAEIKNEFEAKRNKGGTVNKLAIEKVVGMCAAHLDIVQLKRILVPNRLFTVSKYVVALVLGAMSIYFFATNMELREWISGSWLYIIVLAAVITAIYVFASKRRE